MNCPNCGNQLDPNAIFCGNCGANLTNDTIKTLSNNSDVNNPNFNSQQVINNQNSMYQQPIQQQNYNDVNTNTDISTNQLIQNMQSNIKQKKFNPFFIIIPIIILIVGVICYFILVNKNDSTSNNNIDNNTNNNSQTSTKISGWDDYSLFIDGKEIKLPMKFSDFQALGFYEMDTYHDSILTKLCNKNSNCGSTYNSNVGNIYGLFTNGTTSNIELVIYNPFDEQKELKDCYVTRVGFEISRRNNNEFIQAKLGEVKMVNNTRRVEVIMGTTKYEDVESKFGPHYQYDYTNTLTYYPDLESDGVIGMDDLSFDRSLHMYFDNDTRIFEAYDFAYYDMGNLENE